MGTFAAPRAPAGSGKAMELKEEKFEWLDEGGPFSIPISQY